MSFRARKAGDLGGNERKLEKKYDEEEKAGTPQRLMEWMNEVLKGEHPPCTSSRFRDFHNYLKDGVALCRLINKLLEHDNKPCVSFKAKASQRFVASSNTEQFNQAAHYYGVPDSALFQTADLWEGSKGQFLHVLNCLNALGFAANKKEFYPQYETIVPLLAE